MWDKQNFVYVNLRKIKRFIMYVSPTERRGNFFYVPNYGSFLLSLGGACEWATTAHGCNCKDYYRCHAHRPQLLLYCTTNWPSKAERWSTTQILFWHSFSKSLIRRLVRKFFPTAGRLSSSSVANRNCRRYFWLMRIRSRLEWKGKRNDNDDFRPWIIIIIL